MTSDQVGGLIRALASAVGGWAVGKGYLDSDTAIMIGGVAVTVGVAIWSWWTNRAAHVVNTDTGLPKSISPKS